MIKLKLNEDILNSLEGTARSMLNKVIIPAKDLYDKASMHLAMGSDAELAADAVAVNKAKNNLVNILGLDPIAIPMYNCTIDDVDPIDYDQRVELKDRAENVLKNIAELADAIEDRQAALKGKATAEKRRATIQGKVNSTVKQTKEAIINLGKTLIIDHINVSVPYYTDLSEFTADEERIITGLMKERWAETEAAYKDLTDEVAQYGYNIDFVHNTAHEAQLGYYNMKGTQILTTIQKTGLSPTDIETLIQIIKDANIRFGKDSYSETDTTIIAKTTIFGKSIMELICEHEDCIQPAGSYTEEEVLDQEFPALPKEKYPSDYDSDLFDAVEAQITDNVEEE